MNLGEVLEGYWLEKRRNFSKGTTKEYQLTFKRFIAYVGEETPFEKITPIQVRVFLDEMKENGLNPKTLSNYWTALSSLWTWAESEIDAKHIIRGKVAKPKVRRAIIEPYTRADIGLMLNACTTNAPWVTRTTGRTIASERPEKLRDRAILLVLLDTGIRAQELCNLKAKDFDNKAGKLMILHGKGESARKALCRYFVARGQFEPNDAILSTKEGKPMDRAALRKMIVRCAQRGGVKKASVHKFRHTFAINFLRNGGSVLELQHMLGHERLETVRIYASLAESDLQNAQKRASPADKWNL